MYYNKGGGGVSLSRKGDYMKNSKAIILIAQYMGIDKATAAYMVTGKGIIREGDTYEAQVFKEEIIIFKNGEELYSIREKDFKIILKSPGDIRKELTSFGTEEEAESFCKENGWEWIDENGFVWDMDYEEVDLL